MKEIDKEIKRLKKKVIQEVKILGIRENLGQEYVRHLKDEYDYLTDMKVARKIDRFDDWCMTYTGEGC